MALGGTRGDTRLMSHSSGADGAYTTGPIGWIREIVLDCPDPWDLAGFWAGLLGGTPVQWYPGWVTLEPPPHGQRLSFQASTAPPGAGAAKVHFDVLVGDLVAAHDRSSRPARSSSASTCPRGRGRPGSRSAGASTRTRPGTRSASSSGDAGRTRWPAGQSTARPDAP